MPGITPSTAVFSEALVFLPVSYQLNTYVPGAPHLAAVHQRYRREFVTRDRIVVADLNTLHKLEPRVFGVWMAVLRQCPHCDLWLLEVRLPTTVCA